MKIPDRFYIVLRGTKSRVVHRELVQRGVAHNLAQLVTFDGDIPHGFLRPWGITVYIEEDADQGDDS